MNSTILKSNYKIKSMPKFYDMENMTQEHLNEIVLERNTFAKEIEKLNNVISEANKILSNILVIKDSEHKGRYRPIKNTGSQDVYKAIVMLNELFETPYREKYALLQGSDKE